MYRRASRSRRRRTRASTAGLGDACERVGEPHPRFRILLEGFPQGARDVLRAESGQRGVARQRLIRWMGARGLQQRDERLVRVARVDVERHDGQARRIAGACLEGPVPADLHRDLGKREWREPRGGLRQQGQAGTRVARGGTGRPTPGDPPPRGGRSPARAAGRARRCRPAGSASAKVRSSSRRSGLVEDHVEDDGRGAAAMEGIDEIGVLDARPPVRVGRKPERFGSGAVDGDDEDVGRRRASAAEPEQEAEPDRFLQGYAEREEQEQDAGRGRERADAERPAERTPQTETAKPRLCRVQAPLLMASEVRELAAPGSSASRLAGPAAKAVRRRVARVARV